MDPRMLELVVRSIYSSPKTPTCDDFATVMGFAENPTEQIFNNLDEISKLLVTCHLLRKLRSRSTELQQEMVFHKFSALYLPALVNRFLEAPPLPPGSPSDLVEEFKINNNYLEIMGAISHTPYFSKYLRSRLPAAQGGKELMQVVAQRLINVAPIWDGKMIHTPPDREEGYYQSAAGTSIQLLSTLLAAFSKEPEDSTVRISPEVKAALIPWLRKWEQRYRREFLGMVCNRTRNLLNGQDEMMRGAQHLRRKLKNWNVCGNPDCSSTSSLKACGRCQTVRYCCADHQKAHWSHIEEPHKSFCFKADY